MITYQTLFNRARKVANIKRQKNYIQVCKEKCRHTLVAKDFIHHYGNLFNQKQGQKKLISKNNKIKKLIHQLIVKEGINRVALHTLLKCSYCLLPRPKTAYGSSLSHSPLSLPYIHKIIKPKTLLNPALIPNQIKTSNRNLTSVNHL